MTTFLDELLGPLAGQAIPGGCDQCEADQVPHQEYPGVWRLQIRHDDGCPFYARIRRYRGEGDR